MMSKKMKKMVSALLLVLPLFPLSGQTRSFDNLFPALDGAQKTQALTAEGLSDVHGGGEGLRLLPFVNSGLSISAPVLDRGPSVLVESIQLIPYSGSPTGLLQVYNALGKVRDLSGRVYHSFTKDKYVPLFEDAARIESVQKRTALPDPQDRPALPASETIYLRLKDANFGTCYYRADITANPQGLLYSLSNAKSLTYGLIPVIRENKFIAQLYIEPISEGLLIYSIAGADVSDFVASMIDIPSAIQKRLEVIIGWLVDGIG
jgi:hypothetical protein